MFLSLYINLRTAQRLIHIPFAQPNGRFSRANEERLAVARQAGSRSVGVMIAMVSLFGYPKFREILDEEIMLYVEMKLPGLHFRLHKAYSLLLTIANMVSHHYQQALHVYPPVLWLCIFRCVGSFQLPSVGQRLKCSLMIRWQQK